MDITNNPLIVPSIQPAGEWHRTEQASALLSRLLCKVYKPENVLIAHHLNFTKDGRGYEIASVETWLFDHETLEFLFGGRSRDAALQLVLCPPTERLSLLDRMLKEVGL